MKRRILTLVGSAALMLALFAGIAVAAVVENFIDCPNAPNNACFGTAERDELDGFGVNADQLIEARASADTALGGDGNDTMRGRLHADGELDNSDLEFDGGAGNDIVDVGPGNDHEADGDEGNDTILGRDGNDGDRNPDGTCDIGEDSLRGEAGRNTVFGGAGNDCIDAATEVDLEDPVLSGAREQISGGMGNDFIVAVDGVRDTINCGDGTDAVFFDEGIDSIEGCEFTSPHNLAALTAESPVDTGPADDDDN
jgi:Ca2+-binding RTX toxin-like protein